MRIALISYEAPPDTLLGGIGTYVGQAASTLAERGHEVEVFTASERSDQPIAGAYLTHRIRCPLNFEGRLAFPALVGPVVAGRHRQAPFDVMEAPEFLADAGVAKALLPDLPLVIKLHMSMTMIRELNRPRRSGWQVAKDRVKRAARRVVPLKRWFEFDYAALEGPTLLAADEISAPCREIADITARMWQLDRRQMVEVPYPFAPSPQLLQIPIETNFSTVGYIGRLEQRKGVLDFAAAIPLILQRHPGLNFLFAGASERSPRAGVSMQDYLGEVLAPFKERITFLGKVPADRIAEALGRMDIVVLPSLWENFPNACLEAMAAGRGVVGSQAGGMAQQLDGGNAGVLIRPGQPADIVDGVCRLAENPALRMELGRKARERVLTAYSRDRIGKMTEESYASAIRTRRGGGRTWRP